MRYEVGTDEVGTDEVGTDERERMRGNVDGGRGFGV